MLLLSSVSAYTVDRLFTGGSCISNYSSTNIIGMRKALQLFLFILAVHCCGPNCNDCSTSTCSACSEGFELTTDAQCVANTITGCSLYSPAGKCVACQPTFILADSYCEKQYSGCLLKGEGQTCSLCALGKVLLEENCIGKLNCIAGTDNCTQCRQNYTLREGVCVDESADCMLADTLTGVCVMCNPGYTLIGYECISSSMQPVNCYLYDNSGACLACKAGYIMNAVKRCVIPGNFICKQFDEYLNCLNCANDNLLIMNGSCVDIYCKVGAPGNCQQCQTGFSVKNGTVCVLLDPNCRNYSSQSSDRCQVCKLGYYVDIDGVCSRLPSNCAAADIITKTCIQCLIGFNVDNSGACRAIAVISNCDRINPSTGGCLACRFNFYLSNGQCVRVSSLCSAFDPASGSCTNCKTGYLNFGGKCVDPNCAQTSGDTCAQCMPYFSPDALSGACRFSDPNCASLSFLSCFACNPGYYLNLSYCVAFPPFCIQMTSDSTSCATCRTGWTLINGQCVVPVINCIVYAYNGSLSFCKSCVENYQLVNSLCVFSPTTPLDKNCIQFNGTLCIQCSNRYYFSNQVCVPVNPNCKNYSNDGNCTDCYGGYAVSNGKCVIATSITNPNCRRFVNQTCISCYSGYYVDQASNICTAISPLCRTSNPTTGVCLSCFNGFTLMNGACIAASKDPNCIQFNLSGQCINCSSRFFMKGTMCTPINPLCRTFNITTGNCLSCFPGYYLSNGNCLVGSNPNSDVNCKLRDAVGKCLQCYSGYFLSANITCMTSNPLCKTIDFTNGACLSCYNGYTVSSGNCVISSDNASDPNCFKSIGSICSQCFAGYFVRAGVCARINILCRTHNSSNGFCLSCYPGYTISNGQCVIPRAFALSVQDPYCLQRSGTSCIQCSSGYFPLSGVCQNVNPLCRTIGQGGSCTSCYNGYFLQNGMCVIVQAVNIPFCQTIVNGYCQKCIQGYYVQTALQCSPVSILCSTYDQNTGNCLSCIAGYFLQVGQCIYPSMGFDSNCMSYDVSAYCSQCKPGYYLLNYICTRIDPFCVNFDSGTLTCSRCGGGKNPNGAQCV